MKEFFNKDENNKQSLVLFLPHLTPSSFFKMSLVQRVSNNLFQRDLYLIIQAEEVSVILPHLCLCFRDDLTYVPVQRQASC